MRIGFDIGGTKIEVKAFSDDFTEELFSKRIPVPKNNYSLMLSTLADLTRQAEQTTGEKAGKIGLSIPGGINPDTGKPILVLNYLDLNERPLDKDMEKLLSRPVMIANDADCFVLSETMDGAGKGFPLVWGVILGTGVGSGITAFGKLLRGPNAITGEWGENPFPGTDKDNSFMLSGRAIGRNYETLTGEKATGKQVAIWAENGNIIAEKVLAEYEENLARAMAVVINILDPHAIVLGGGVSKLKRLYSSVPELLKKYVAGGMVKTKILPAKFGDTSGIRGAARLGYEL